MKKLAKSNDKKLCGVCGGIAEYFGWDPTLVRIVWFVVTCFAGAGLLIYIAAAVIMPDADPDNATYTSTYKEYDPEDDFDRHSN